MFCGRFFKFLNVTEFLNVTKKGKNVKNVKILTSKFKLLDEGELLALTFPNSTPYNYKTNKNILSNLIFVLVASLTTGEKLCDGF